MRGAAIFHAADDASRVADHGVDGEFLTTPASCNAFERRDVMTRRRRRRCRLVVARDASTPAALRALHVAAHRVGSRLPPPRSAGSNNAAATPAGGGGGGGGGGADEERGSFARADPLAGGLRHGRGRGGSRGLNERTRSTIPRISVSRTGRRRRGCDRHRKIEKNNRQEDGEMKGEGSARLLRRRRLKLGRRASSRRRHECLRRQRYRDTRRRRRAE